MDVAGWVKLSDAEVDKSRSCRKDVEASLLSADVLAEDEPISVMAEEYAGGR